MEDLTKIEKPFGLLSRPVQDSLVNHFYRGGKIESYAQGGWRVYSEPSWVSFITYRAKPVPAPTHDTIDWSSIKPEWKYAARDEDGNVYVYQVIPSAKYTSWVGWSHDDGLGINPRLLNIHTRGTCDWKDSLIKRPDTGE